MKTCCDGFIFFMTLCIIFVISLLLIACMQHVLLLHKAINQQELAHQKFYQLENLAIQLASARQLSIDKECVQYGDSANQVLQQLKRKEGCLLVLGKDKYRYIIENLGDFPCLVFYMKGQKFASNHSRISVVLSEEDKEQAAALQIRFIRPVRFVNCLQVEHKITAGISSWRYFPYLK